LDGVLATAAVGVLAGGRTLADLAAIAAELSQPQLRALRAWQNPKTKRREAPSESTFQRVLRAVDAARLDQLLGQWLLADGAEHALICVDGKTLKGTDVPEKTNEIPMLPVLLQEVPLVGTLVTADALHTQTDTARHLVQERGADYLFVVKDNQPALRAHCARLFPEPAFSPCAFAVRKRPRAHRDSGGPRAYGSRRRNALSPVAQVARVDRRREWSDGTVQEETVFAITSRPADALGELALGAALRAHWGIENGVHYRRDRTYDEDRCQFQENSTPQVMASFRNLAIAARHYLAPRCARLRDRTLPQMHRRLAAKPHRAVALLTKPWNRE
jgi:predicted transposase YbfD/YdcC